MQKMNIKLVAVDMDGTLLDSRKNVPPDFEEWVLNHPDVKVVAASGRQYYTLMDLFPRAGGNILYSAENGGLVFDHGDNIFRDAMKREDVLACLEEADKLPGVTPILCAVDSAYMCHAGEWIESQGHMYYHHLTFLENLAECPEFNQTVKVSYYVEGDRAADVFKLLHFTERIRPVVSGTDWIDINNSSVNKGMGIRVIQDKYHIDKEESMAFGDYMNDFDMLKACSFSFAMANACSELKAIAAYETASNDEDGVMKVLRNF